MKWRELPGGPGFRQWEWAPSTTLKYVDDYVDPVKIYRGEIGYITGVRIVKSPQTKD